MAANIFLSVKNPFNISKLYIICASSELNYNVCMSQFLQTARQTTRRLGLADATEKSYASWTKRFIIYHGYQSPEEMESAPRQAIETYLSHLARLGYPNVSPLISCATVLPSTYVGAAIPSSKSAN